MTPLSSLLTSPTQDSVRATLVTGLTNLGIPAGSWKKGGTWSTILPVVSATFAGFAGMITGALSSAFLPQNPSTTSTNPWLVLLAYYVYGLTANQATYATGPFTLVNSGGLVVSYPAFGATFANSKNQTTYQNSEPFTITAFGTATFTIQCTIPGSAGNAVPGPGLGSVDTLVTSMLGVTGSNPDAILGLDGDTDYQIVQKCLNRLAARSYQGPSGAYYSAVDSSLNSSGKPVNVNRRTVVLDPITGVVTVYIASPSGPVTAGDLLAVQNNVTAVAQPGCVTATVVQAVLIDVPSAITVWATGTGSNPPANLTSSSIVAALTAYASSYPIGGLTKPPSVTGYMYASAVEGVIKAVDPSIYAIDGVTYDLAIAVGHIAVLLPTVTIRWVSR